MKNYALLCNSKRLLKALFSITAGLVFVFNIFLSAGHAEQAAGIYIGSTDIYVTPAAGGITFMMLRVAGPEGEVLFDQSSAGLPIQWTVPSWAPDGHYTYEVQVGFGVQTGAREENEQPSVQFRPWVQSGTVSIRGGAIVPPTEEEGSLLKDFSQTLLPAFARLMDILIPPAYADNVILDDLIVDGSACVGMDCVNGEAWGFDTLRLKENNLRIKFQDTSASASFPSNDWQITVNDTANGGLNKFSIDDIDGGKTPFTIEAGAPSNSLYVDDGGRVGLGTAIPVVDLHVVSGNTPTTRLEQNGTSGWTPQTWDVAGNETNFFIRDVTKGSLLPFRIRPGAPTSSLDISKDGNVGLGTSSPQAKTHITGSDSNNSFQLQIMGHTGGTSHAQIVTNQTDSRLTVMASSADDFAPRIIFTGPEDGLVAARGGAIFDFGSNNFDLPDAKFRFRHYNTAGPVEMLTIFGRDAVTFPKSDVNVGIRTTNPQHAIQVTDGGAWSDGTNWVDVSTREAKDNILELKTEEALATLKNIKPVKFSYKQDAEKETNVGFIAEDVPDLVATKGRKGLVSMEVVAVLTKVVQQQQEMIVKLNKEMVNLKEQIKKSAAN